MSLNVLILAALADLIASHFSVDAAEWPVPARAQRAIPVRWLAGEAGEEVRQMVEALRARTIAPYRTLDDARAVPIVNDSEHEPALAVVTFWREILPGEGEGLRYEVTFPGREDVLPGWLATSYPRSGRTSRGEAP